MRPYTDIIWHILRHHTQAIKHAFGSATEGIYLQIRSDGKVFNLSRLKAESKVHHRCLCDFFFADDDAVTAHSAEYLQQLMDRFSQTCKDFGLTILTKTHVKAQEIGLRLYIQILNHELDVVHDFIYLGSTVSDSLSLNSELQKRIGEASTTIARLVKRMLTNSKLSEHTKI